MKNKLLIIIPAYNEAENIEHLVDNLTIHYPQYDYIIINDGSKDQTGDICRSKNFYFLDMPVNLGLTNAIRCGMRYACQNGYEYALQFDGDGQHQPQFIQDMINAMKERNADIVIGSRFKTQKKPFSARMIGSRLISLCIFLTSGKSIQDVTSGMRLFNQRMIRQFAYENNYSPEPDTLSYLLRQGILIEEVQVSMLERTAGQSYFNLGRSFIYMAHVVLSILIFQWFRKGIKE